MNIEVSLDAARAIERIGRGHKLPFLAVRAINSTGEAVQEVVRARIASTYTMRKPEFIRRQVKLFKASFSTATGVGRWEARVGIGIGKPPTGSPLLLPRFEVGGARAGTKGGGVAIPVVGGARPAQVQSIPEALWIRRLALRRPARSARKRRPSDRGRGQAVRQGLLGTYQLPGIGIFQRVAGKAVRLLYAFKPTVRLPATLQFYRTARRVITTNFARNVQRLVNEAFARHG